MQREASNPWQYWVCVSTIKSTTCEHEGWEEIFPESYSALLQSVAFSQFADVLLLDVTLGGRALPSRRLPTS
jgi:hypothetical protein